MSSPRIQSEIEREILRLSVSLTALHPNPYEQREIQGALHALSWAAGLMRSAPVDWMFRPGLARVVDQLTVGRLLEMIEAREHERLPELHSLSFLERSLPAGDRA